MEENMSEIVYYWKFDDFRHQMKIEITNEPRHPSHPKSREFYDILDEAIKDKPTFEMICVP